jgi:hypothetical protein
MSRLTLVALGAALLGGVRAAPAQTAPARPSGLAVASAPVVPPARPGLLVGTTRLGLSQSPSPDAAAAHTAIAPLPRDGLRHRGPGVALMLVGAAGVVTGLLLSENIITILGAGTGLVGLYLYLR